MMEKYLEKESGSIIIMYVLVEPWFSLTKGCLKVSKQNRVSHNILLIRLEMFFN